MYTKEKKLDKGNWASWREYAKSATYAKWWFILHIQSCSSPVQFVRRHTYGFLPIIICTDSAACGICLFAQNALKSNHRYYDLSHLASLIQLWALTIQCTSYCMHISTDWVSNSYHNLSRFTHLCNSPSHRHMVQTSQGQPVHTL